MTLQKDASQAEGTTAPATPVSNEKLLGYIVKLNKRTKRLEGLISDAFQKIADLEDKEDQLVDEAVDRSSRAERAVRRLKKDFDAHTHEEA